MSQGLFSAEQLADYQQDGYVLVRSLFDPEEIDLLRRAAKEDRAMDEHAFGRSDGEGGSVRLSLWNHPGDDLYGMFARCRRMVDTVEQVLEDEAYHYHSKMIMKQAVTGGAGNGIRIMAIGTKTGFSIPIFAVCLLPSMRQPEKTAACKY